MFKRYFLICSLFLSAVTGQDLFISDWYAGIREAPVYSQMIELYNPTDSDIDLSDYALSGWTH